MSALTKGDTVLITGGTGWVGSHVAHEALGAGLKIKLAIRSEEKARVLIEALNKIYGDTIGDDNNIETVLVRDFGEENAYDEAVKGVQGIIHAASDLSLSNKPDQVIPPVIKAYNNLFNAANSQNQIRRIVLTSSSIALGYTNVSGRETQHFDVDTWNDVALDRVKSPSPTGLDVYGASKVLSERLAWNFVKENNPSFIVNVINPNLILGAPVSGMPYSRSGSGIPVSARGGPSFFENVAPQWHVDVEDVAKLHIIAVIREDVKNERILAFGTRFNYNTIIDLIKKVKPDAKTPVKLDKWDALDNTTVNVSRANELLKEQGGLRDLEYSVRSNLIGV